MAATTQNPSHKAIESYVPDVRLQNGIYTRLPLVTTSSATFGGNVAVTGTITASGGITSLKPVVDLTGSTAAPTVNQSGSIFLLDNSTGITITLPAPTIGVQYHFIVKTTVASNSYKIITDTGTTLITGSILASSDNLASKSFIGNGTTHLAVTQAAASSNATGGIIGSSLTFTCISSTLWEVAGTTVASATPTTPFATS